MTKRQVDNLAGLISPATVGAAVSILLGASPPGTRVILFGSYARGDATVDSDLDFLVVRPTLTSRRAESVRLRQLLRPLGVPADVLIVSRRTFEAWKGLPSNVIHEAFTEGRAYGHAGRVTMLVGTPGLRW